MLMNQLREMNVDFIAVTDCKINLEPNVGGREAHTRYVQSQSYTNDERERSERHHETVQKQLVSLKGFDPQKWLSETT